MKHMQDFNICRNVNKIIHVVRKSEAMEIARILPTLQFIRLLLNVWFIITLVKSLYEEEKYIHSC